jgi:hypothetical protein
VLILFASSVSITQLASIKHGHLFPWLQTWLGCQNFPQELEALAIRLVADFDGEIKTDNKDGNGKQ